VRYKPEVDSRTILLWATPALVVLIGLVIVALTIRRSGRAFTSGDVLTDEERARAFRLLNDSDKRDHSSR
jgi:cytochrome c-type biogenesis protein CcmH